VHEYSIVQELLSVAAVEARRAGAVRVTGLHCRIGALRQLDHRLLLEAFELLRSETVCAEAELRIETTFVTACCGRCQHEYAVHDWNWDCPRCGGSGHPLGGGDELDLISLEAEIAA